MKLSKDYRLIDFLVSAEWPEMLRGIHIPPHYKWNLQKLCMIHLQNIADFVGTPLPVLRGYITPALNKRQGLPGRCQHMYGEAALLGGEGKKLENALTFAKLHLWPAIGECIDFRNPDNEIVGIYISLPDPYHYQKFLTRYIEGEKLSCRS